MFHFVVLLSLQTLLLFVCLLVGLDCTPTDVPVRVQVADALDRGLELVGRCSELGRLQAIMDANDIAASFANVAKDLVRTQFTQAFPVHVYLHCVCDGNPNSVYIRVSSMHWTGFCKTVVLEGTWAGIFCDVSI